MEGDKNKGMIDAAQFFRETAQKLMTTDGKLQAETLIVSAARVSGSMTFRRFLLKQRLVPGTTVMSNEANIHGPKLMNAMLVTLQGLGRQIGEQNLNRDYFSAKYSQLVYKESHDRLDPFFMKYREAAKMSLQDAALAGAVATGMLVHDCRQVLSVEKAAALAVFGFVEGTKTAPFPIPFTVPTKGEESAGRTWP